MKNRAFCGMERLMGDDNPASFREASAKASDVVTMSRSPPGP